MDNYTPKDYWEHRLVEHFSLKGVGHSSFSASYNQWLYRRKTRCIESSLNGTTLAGADVLDIGCGTGFFVDWYSRRGAKVCGIDITDVSVERLRATYPGEFYVKDIGEPGLPFERKFDIVNMWDVAYHIVEPTRFNQTFANISAATKSGGLLLVTDWFGASSDARPAPHVLARCLATYKACLSEHGFHLAALHPLYNKLNKIHVRIGKFNFPICDDYLAWLYYLLDNMSTHPATDNLSLSVWQRSHNDTHNSIPASALSQTQSDT